MTDVFLGESMEFMPDGEHSLIVVCVAATPELAMLKCDVRIRGFRRDMIFHTSEWEDRTIPRERRWSRNVSWWGHEGWTAVFRMEVKET